MGIWWPAADSAKLRAAAHAWREMAHAVDAVQAASQPAVLNLLADNQGPAMDAFAAYWLKWSGDAGYLPACSQACVAMAKALESYAQAVDEARRKVEELVAEVATAVVLGVVLGICTVGIAAGAAAAVSETLIASALLVGVELSTAVSAIAATILVGAAFGAVEAMAIDALAIQPERMLVFHDQKDFNWNEVFQWGEWGAAGGVVGGGFAVGIRAARGGFEETGAITTRLNPATAVDGDGNFAVGIHSEWPSPRPLGMESHHGVMSAWAKANVPGYEAGAAPTVLMPEEAHAMTKIGYNLWRAEIKSQVGEVFDWTKISESQARDLAEHLFSGADVPMSIRAQYWEQFNRYLLELRAAAS